MALTEIKETYFDSGLKVLLQEQYIPIGIIMEYIPIGIIMVSMTHGKLLLIAFFEIRKTLKFPGLIY